jgi:hypothetical protein
MEIDYIKQFLQDSHGIISQQITTSDQWQTHEWYFIDSDYFLKIYKSDQFDNALTQSSYGPKIIAHGTRDNQSYILYKQISWITVAELLPSLSIDDQNIVFSIITQILKNIHQESRQVDWLHKVHGDYHIGNILVYGDRKNIDNYTVIDRDMSSIWSFEDEYEVIVETIAVPVAMVSQALEKHYQDIQLLNRWSILKSDYPEFIIWKEQTIKKAWIIRADIKFAYKDWTNARANAMGNKIMEFIEHNL